MSAAEQQTTDFNQSADAGEETIETLRTQRDEWEEKAKRYAAEVENLRKRTEKEVQDAHKYAVTKFATELLAVQDNMERAFDAARANRKEGEESAEVKALMDGIDMVANQMNSALGKMRIERIETSGEKFDPERHQVMMEVEAPAGKQPGEIVQEFQAGYTIAGRLLRPALVSTARK